MEIKLILDHLKKETALYKEFIGILQKETENLVNRDFKGLYETVALKEHALKRIESLGTLRAKLIKNGGAALGVRPGAKGEVTLMMVIEALGERRVEIEAERNIIISLIESIKEINKVNSLVVTGSLENINKTLGFLGNFLQTSVYKPSGAFEGFSPKGSRLSEGA
ncbi:MAG: flagellar protein FlgN [Deltaproteobacteria bacterium]|nr:flagellar protein FlgN [Deltaproteobacteria bacterium]